MPRFKLRTLLIILVVVPLLNSGCGNREAIPAIEANALASSEQFELLSLEPEASFSQKVAEGTEVDRFHGWAVLGKTALNSETRLKLVAALRKGVSESDGTVASCFMPRHGIRVTHDGKLFDFVICFQCMSVQTFIDDRAGEGFLVTHSPQPTFDEVLRGASVPLAGGNSAP
jgi:hypothetical protein